LTWLCRLTQFVKERKFLIKRDSVPHLTRAFFSSNGVWSPVQDEGRTGEADADFRRADYRHFEGGRGGRGGDERAIGGLVRLMGGSQGRALPLVPGRGRRPAVANHLTPRPYPHLENKEDMRRPQARSCALSGHRALIRRITATWVYGRLRTSSVSDWASAACNRAAEVRPGGHEQPALLQIVSAAIRCLDSVGH